MDGFTQSLLMFPKFLVGFGCPVCFPNGFQNRASRLLLENAPTEYRKTVYCITSTSCDEKMAVLRTLGQQRGLLACDIAQTFPTRPKLSGQYQPFMTRPSKMRGNLGALRCGIGSWEKGFFRKPT